MPFTPIAFEGSVPLDMRGTYYLNGPTRFERNGRRYLHWLDGDGALLALRFHGGGVSFARRLIPTTRTRLEDEAGRPLFRTFGTAFEGDRLREGVMLEPSAGINVVWHGGRLLAFGEQGLPWDVDPDTLETRGEYDFDGTLSPVSPIAAHPKIDPFSGQLIAFGVTYSPARPRITVYAVGGRRRRVPLERAHMLHDCGLTATHVIFHLSGLTLDTTRFLVGASVADALCWDASLQNQLLLVPRDGSPVTTVPMAPGSVLHFIGCRIVDGETVVDFIESDAPVYPQYAPLPALFETVPAARPVRCRVDVERARVVSRSVLPYEAAPDFPVGRGDDFWALGISRCGEPGPKMYDTLVHGNWMDAAVEEWRAPHGTFLGGEPHYAAGCVIVQRFERSASAFLIFDAADVARGPMAVLPTPVRMHFGFHGVFVPARKDRDG